MVDAASCPNAPKLDPRVRRTRKLLEDALRALMKERPYSEISVQDIAERATINRATFYAHFGDKDHLATTMLRDDLERAILAQMEPGLSLNAENLVKVGAAIFEFMVSLHRGCTQVGEKFDEGIGATLQAGIQEFLQTWLTHDPDAMRAFPGSSSEAVATVLSWSLYGGALRWSRQHHRRPAEQAAREVVALLLR